MSVFRACSEEIPFISGREILDSLAASTAEDQAAGRVSAACGRERSKGSKEEDTLTLETLYHSQPYTHKHNQCVLHTSIVA